MFDVVICALSLAILVAVVITGPLAGYLTRRRAARATAPAHASRTPAPPVAAAPAPVIHRPRQTTVPKIVRLNQDSTSVLPAATQVIATPETTEVPVATTALRIQRRPKAASPPADATEHMPTPPEPKPDESPS
jgi:hypothetical protein